MPDTIQDLRVALFDTLSKVRSNEIPIDKARVICEISAAIINSAKVEVDFIKAVNSKKGSGFIELENSQDA